MPNFQNFVAVATALGPKYKKEASRAASLDIQINSFRKQIKNVRRKLAKESILSPETLVEEAPNVPPKLSLTEEQLDIIRTKHMYGFQNGTSKQPYQPSTRQTEPSLPREMVRKVRKAQKLNMKKTLLKGEIIALAKEVEKTTMNEVSTKVGLSAVPPHISEAVCSEFYYKSGVDRARKR